MDIKDAIKPYYMDADGPPCALKIGPINCFCTWDGSPNPLEAQQRWSHEATNLTVAPPGPEVARMLHRPSKSYEEHRIEAGDDCLESTSAGSTGVVAGGLFAGERQNGGCEHPLLTVVRLHAGHTEPLPRQLQAIQSQAEQNGGIDSLLLERLRVVVSQHRPSPWTSTWPVYEKAEEGAFGPVGYGANVVHGTCHWFRSAEFTGSNVSVLKGLAAFLEVDLAHNYSREVVAAEPLGVHTAKRDAVWRVLVEGRGTASHGRQQESMWSYGFVDALDEPIGALLVFAHTPPEHQAGPGGLSLLAAQPIRGLRGSATDFECIIHCVEPIWQEGMEGGKACISPVGFRLTQTGVSTVSSLGGQAFAPGLKHGTGDSEDYKQWHRKLSTFIAKDRPLDERMQMSPRTELYNRVRRHLQSNRARHHFLPDSVPRSKEDNLVV